MTQHKLTTDFVATLQDISLRAWQARTASTIGIKSGQKQADFLRSELERIELVSKAAIDKAADAQDARDAITKAQGG